MSRRQYAGGPLARYLLIGAVLFLSLFGLVMIYSASSVSDYVKFGDSAYHLKRQLQWLALGLPALFLAARVDYRALKRITWPLLVAVDAMLVLVLTHGSAKWGAQRWLYIGPLGIQPSEFAKFAVVLSLALVLSRPPSRDWTFGRRMLWCTGIALPVVALIMAQPDMGTTMVIVIATFVMLMLGGTPWRYLGGTIAALAVAVPAMIAFEPYRVARFTSFLDPWKDPKGDGYQIIQALYAFGSGGLRGIGLGLSRQKYFYLPAAHTDFIFAIIGEELGLLGTVAIIAGFVVLAYAGIRIAMAARDPFGKLLAGGLTALVVTQAVMNIAAVTSLMPVTGIPLPLVSYGGSSVTFTLACIGFILSVGTYGMTGKRARIDRHPQEETRVAGPTERRRDGRPHLSSIDGGRAPVRRRA